MTKIDDLYQTLLNAYDAQDWEALTVLSRPLVIYVINKWNFNPHLWQNEDLVQTTLMKIFKYLPNFQLRDSPHRGKSLTNIIYKLAKNQVQTPGRAKRFQEDQLISQNPNDNSEAPVNYNEATHNPFDAIETRLHLMALMRTVLDDSQHRFSNNDKKMALQILSDLEADELSFAHGTTYLKDHQLGPDARWFGFCRRLQRLYPPLTHKEL